MTADGDAAGVERERGIVSGTWIGAPVGTMIAVPVAVVAAVLAAWWYLTRRFLPLRLVCPARRGPAYWSGRLAHVHPSELGLAVEEVRLRARDGVRLVAWYLPAGAAARGTVLVLHGVGGSRLTTLQTSAWLVREGYDVLTWDSRGAGESEGTFCTFGFYEKHDVCDAITWVQTRAGRPMRVGIVGKSMGGAIALQAAALDARIACVIAEAPFAELGSITRDYQRRMLGTGWRVLHRAAIRHAEALARFRVEEVSPRRAVTACATPVMLVHGAADPLVAARYSQTLFAAARGPKELYLVPDGGHGGLYGVAGEEFNRRRLAFLERYLGAA